MKPFRFCPGCGGSLAEPHLEDGVRCGSCGRHWYRNPAPTVAAAIVADGRALVAVRAREPERGRIDVPGGFLHVDEQPLVGLRREVTEELGVAIDVTEDDFVQAVAHRYGEEGDWLLSLGFAARVVSGEPSASDDVESIRWVAEDELEELDWAWPHDLDLVRKAFARG